MTRNGLYQSLADQIRLADQLLEMRVNARDVGDELPAHWNQSIAIGVSNLNALNRSLAGQRLVHATLGSVDLINVGVPIWLLLEGDVVRTRFDPALSALL